MKNYFVLAFVACAALAPTPAHAAAGNFALVNKTGAAIASLAIRRAGTAQWRPLSGAPGNGARAAITFSDPDCAFDIQAKTADGQALTYGGVNLCDVATVTLNRSSSGNLWVDYD